MRAISFESPCKKTKGICTEDILSDLYNAAVPGRTQTSAIRLVKFPTRTCGELYRQIDADAVLVWPVLESAGACFTSDESVVRFGFGSGKCDGVGGRDGEEQESEKLHLGSVTGDRDQSGWPVSMIAEFGWLKMLL